MVCFSTDDYAGWADEALPRLDNATPFDFVRAVLTKWGTVDK